MSAPYESVEPAYCAHGIPLEVECYHCAVRPPTPEESFLEAAQAVSTARVAYSTAFLRFKNSGSKNVTDHYADQQAIVETGSELDMALARLELARRALDARD